jgi:hypothetical protein
MSNVRALISRTRSQRFRATGTTCETALQSTQMQFAQSPTPSASASDLWSASERRFALLEKSASGLRFAHLNSQKVGVQRAHSPSRGSNPVRRQRVTHCESRPRFARVHCISARRSLWPAPFPHATSGRFGHQRPNPSVEGTAKRLRLLSAPHLER